MKHEDFNTLVREARAAQDDILLTKGADYADQGVFGDDKLANFKEVERRLRGAPLDATTICAVYWLKHVIAMERWVRDRKVSSEPIEGRFDDEANYNPLLRACAQEYQEDERGFGLPPADPNNEVTDLVHQFQEEGETEQWHNDSCEDEACQGCDRGYGAEDDESQPTCGCHALGLNCFCGTNEEEEEEIERSADNG